MKTLARFSAWLAISICLPVVVGVHTSSSGMLQQSRGKDTLKVQIESNTRFRDVDTFKLLPKFNNQMDTAGFQYIPKYYDERGTNDADFVPYDKEPQIIKKVEPTYPERAIRAGLEGKVIVKMWVDKDGKVEKVVVLKSDAEIFNEPAIGAAKQFVFTPAYMNKKPVAVWVSYPFLFRLPNRR